MVSCTFDGAELRYADFGYTQLSKTFGMSEEFLADQDALNIALVRWSDPTFTLPPDLRARLASEKTTGPETVHACLQDDERPQAACTLTG